MGRFTIRGQVIKETDRTPLIGFEVEAWAEGKPKGPLGAAASDASGHFKIALGESRLKGGQIVSFRVLVAGKEICKSSELPTWSPKSPDRPVVLALSAAAAKEGTRRRGGFEIEGRVTDERGVAVAGARVEVADLGPEGEILLGEARTDDRGRYVVAYEPSVLKHKAVPDLVVRVWDTQGDRGALARSAVSYRAGARETVDLSVSSGEVEKATEYERLLDAISSHLADTDLGGLSPEGVTHVANKSGWDARAVAMAAEAARLGKETDLPASHYYALFRSGVGAGKSAVNRLSTGGLERALKAAVEKGVIAADDSIEGSIAKHRAAAAATLAETRSGASMSTLSEMLALSLDDGDRSRFLEVYLDHGDRPAALWQALREGGFDEAVVTRLQTNARLGFMTLQNRSLVGRVMELPEFDDTADLARQGLYEPQAGEDQIGDDVPDGITREAYARGLAAQVSLSYPALVTSELVRRGEVAVGSQSVQTEVADFLAPGDGEKRIGFDRVKTWPGYEELDPEAQAGARAVERMYQMSPSNGSMIALGQIGLQSAYQVMRFSKSGFMAAHGGDFPTEAEAAMVYDKAQEIHATALNVATSYLTHRASPNVYAISGARKRGTPDIPPEIPGAPTLEELFTNLDYCACEHCKSVLSPAAYLVDLLRFIDLTDTPHELRNPIDVLLERRPDLQHILLSCQNTNVVLPYVDIVNEILEHYIVNGSLGAFVGFNMREDSSSADLLADPEFVTDAAYVQTSDEVYPWNLPFDMSLEALRLLMSSMDIQLADAWSIFRSAADARREAIGLSDDEYAILTDTAFRELPEYFGEPAGASIAELNGAVADGKTFSRRTAITHQELVELLETRFVNPGVVLVPALRQLRLSLATIQDWFDGTISESEILDKLPEDLDPAPYNGDVTQWLDDNRQLIMGMVTLTDVSPEPVECDFAQVELRLALPDMMANHLTALEYHKLLRLIRLWKKLGWSLAATDELVSAFLDLASEDLTLANLDAAFIRLLDRVGNFLRLAGRLSLSRRKREAWLRIWSTEEDPAQRRERLGRLLRLGITDLENLIELSGIDPLADDMADDSPSMLLFVDLYKRLKRLGLKVADLDYLLRHRDASGSATPEEATLLRDLKALRDAMSGVETQLSASPESLDMAFVQAKMALVYDSAVVEWLLGLVDGSTTHRAPFVMAEETLPQKLADASPSLGYDPFAKELTFVGLMSATTRGSLNAAADALTLGDVEQITDQPTLDGLIADFKTAVEGLFDAGVADLQALDGEYPELKTAYDAAAVLQDPEAQARALLEAVLPDLRRQLKETALRATLSKLLRTEADLGDAMLAVTAANADPGQGVLSDFFALETAVALAADGSHRIYLDPPGHDDYILYVRAPENTTVSLTLGGDVVIPATAVGPTGELSTAVPISLEVGVPVPAELTLANLPASAAATLLWRTRGIAKRPVPASRIYDDTRVVEARASLIRLQKAAMTSALFGLTPRELTHFGNDDAATSGFVDELPVAGGLAGPALQSLWGKVASLVWFLDWRSSAEPEENAFVQILGQPDLPTPQGDPLLAQANGWSAQILAAVLGAFGLTLADLSSLANMRRVVEAMRLLSEALYPAPDLVAWSTAPPDAALIASAKESLRQRLDARPWRDTLQAVNDELRNRRLDALVSYILHHQPPAAGVDTAERLYEHFLVDVQMDSCRQTSRIRQALSSIQLFITRCLMNLESEVAASSIREDHWQWMKRYRVWEANRKVFLYPENWLEPELRDGKSPFFRELEANLLKSDLTQELAEDAYFGYLKKLDDVARLRIAGSYLEQRTPGDAEDDILHVIGRTSGNTREHYYRRLEYGYWTPWEKITLNIEGDLLLPVVWKSRLFLFWPIVLEKGDAGQPNATPQELGDKKWTDSAKKTIEISLGWGEYYKGKWVSPKSTDMKWPMFLEGVSSFDTRYLAMAARTHQPPALSERLIVSLWVGGGHPGFELTFTSKNVPPIVDYGGADDVLKVDVMWFNGYLFGEAYSSYFDGYVFGTQSPFAVTVNQPPHAKNSQIEQMVLKTPGSWTVRPLWHEMENQWEAPFFYWDPLAQFFVQGEEVRSFDLKRKDPGFYLILPELEYEVRVPPLQEIPEIPDDPLGPWVNPVKEVMSGVTAHTRVLIGEGAAFEYGGVRFGPGGALSEVEGRI